MTRGTRFLRNGPACRFHSTQVQVTQPDHPFAGRSTSFPGYWVSDLALELELLQRVERSARHSFLSHSLRSHNPSTSGRWSVEQPGTLRRFRRAERTSSPCVCTGLVLHEARIEPLAL